ncbi:hypothetical protein ACFFQW_19150 [Umezawaea endophytica]|uniref:Uncharacterized protein n=1 Tax=Umezawaea endophytica TaxID=1654476 RepID=A0A9X3A4G0_9PSEU|nr:hypothetical protein [Umezawaea endophytica]MCS7481198.1 hypothetical protein [Umezawaea endophytica]
MSDESPAGVLRSAVESALRQVLDASGAPDPGALIDQAMLDFTVRVTTVRRELAELAEREPLGEVAAARTHLGVAFGHFGNGSTAEGRAELITARALLTGSDDADLAHQWSL